MTAEKIVANGWTADLPDGWEDRSMITLVGATGPDGFAPNIVVTRQKVDAAMKIEAYAAMQAQLMQNEVGGTLQVIDERVIEINGASSFQRLQRFAVESDGRIIQQVQTFLMDEGIIYAITGTASLESFDRSIPAFKKFVETFNLDHR